MSSLSRIPRLAKSFIASSICGDPIDIGRRSPVDVQHSKSRAAHHSYTCRNAGEVKAPGQLFKE